MVESTTLNVYPETSDDLDDIVKELAKTQPRPNKKEVLRFVVRKYKEELGLKPVAEVRV